MAEQGAGLRGLVGAGRSKVSLSAAARVRDRGRPNTAEIAAAEAEIDRRLADRPPVTRAAAGRSPTAGPVPVPGAAAAAAPATATAAAPTTKAPTPGDVGARQNRDRSRHPHERT